LAHGYAATVWIESRSRRVSSTVYSHFQDKEACLRLINAWLRKVPLNFDLANAKVLQTAPEIILKI